VLNRLLSLSFHTLGARAYHSLLWGRESMTQRMVLNHDANAQVRTEAVLAFEESPDC